MRKFFKFLFLIFLFFIVMHFTDVYAKEISVDNVIAYMKDNNVLKDDEYFYMFGRMLNGNGEYNITDFSYKIFKENNEIFVFVTLNDKKMGKIQKNVNFVIENNLIKFTNKFDKNSLDSRVATVIFNQLIYSIGGVRGYNKDIIVNWMNEINLDNKTVEGITGTYEKVRYSFKENSTKYEYEINVPLEFEIDINKISDKIPDNLTVKIHDIKEDFSSVSMKVLAKNQTDKMCIIYRKNENGQYEKVGRVSCNNGKFVDRDLKEKTTYYYQAVIEDQIMCANDVKITTTESPNTGVFDNVIGILGLFGFVLFLNIANNKNFKIKKIIPKFKLFIIPLIIFMGVGLKVNFMDHKVVNEVHSLKFLSSNKENYVIQEVRMLAISLRVQGEYDDKIKIEPLTCKVNVNRVVKLIYMDGTHELGDKYVGYNKPVGELMQPTKKGYNFNAWYNKNGQAINDNYVLKSLTDYKIYADWNIVVSKLTVDPNAGTWDDLIGSQTYNLKYLQKKKINDPTRVGYTFTSWEVKGEDSTIVDKEFTMGVEDSSLKALWKANEYNLSINPNGGEYEGSKEITNKTILYDSTVTIDDPVRPGYTFGGWTVSNGELNGKEFFMNYAGDVTFTANWIINKYDYIVYHKKQSVDGSSYNIVENDTETGTVNYHTVISPEVKSYIGFSSPLRKDMTIEIDENPPLKNILEYKYERNKYTLTINPNEGMWKGLATNSEISLYYEQTYQVENPSRVGYNFTNWTKSTEDSSMTDQIFKMGLTSTTLRANWVAKTYILTYNVNGGNILDTKSKTITFDKAYGTLPTPTRVGYKFAGWYTSAVGGERVDEYKVHKVDDNVTIYAHWTAKTYTLTYNVNGGEALSTNTKTITFDEAYGTLPTPTRVGYSFDGWYTNASGGEIVDENKVHKVDDNVTIYAHWTAKTYTLTYEVNGGKPLGDKTKTITFDKAYGALPKPTRDGYTFDGWYTSASGGDKVDENKVHKVDSNVTIYAHWINNSPSKPTISVEYKNSTGSEGLLKNNSETITVTITSTDKEDGAPKISLSCKSGDLCKHVSINETSNSNGRAVYTLTASKVGIGQIEATATDSVGASSKELEVIYVFSEGGGISADDAKFTNTTFDSDWLEALDGCYISDFTFTVKFLSSHSNSDTSDPDKMIVWGKTESGSEVKLYEWSGNMEGDLHESETINLSKYENDKIVSIRFYTYSPHNDCARDATITYSAKYTFDRSLLKDS